MSDLEDFFAIGVAGTQTVSATVQDGTVLSVADGDGQAIFSVTSASIIAESDESVTLVFGLAAARAATDVPTLLPHNASPLELALEQSSKRIFGLDVPVSQLWDVDACPKHLLGWLAWALSVDDWDAEWPEETKRAVIAASVAVHRRKGTVGAVKAALAAAGYGSAIVIEGSQANVHDGSVLADGLETYGDDIHWAEYQVILSRPITFDQAAMLREICGKVAPARCHLAALDYREASNRYDAAISNDGAYSHGVN